MLTQEYLKSILHYDPLTGEWIWIINKGPTAPAGSHAGTLHKGKCSGYIEIMIDGITYKAHILAFLYMTGELPKDLVDHKNGIRSDNEWTNLREATQSQQSQNHKQESHSLTGIRGVYYTGEGTTKPWFPKKKPWKISIMKEGKSIRRRFYTKEEAINARRELMIEIFGEFARIE